ncbi:hypothetical protein MKD33_11205, partial [Chromobacterium piscinae]
GLMGLAADAAL